MREIKDIGYKFDFGKHRGKRLLKVMMTDFNYVAFLVKQDRVKFSGSAKDALFYISLFKRANNDILYYAKSNPDSTGSFDGYRVLNAIPISVYMLMHYLKSHKLDSECWSKIKSGLNSIINGLGSSENGDCEFKIGGKAFNLDDHSALINSIGNSEEFTAFELIKLIGKNKNIEFCFDTSFLLFEDENIFAEDDLMNKISLVNGHNPRELFTSMSNDVFKFLKNKEADDIKTKNDRESYIYWGMW